MLLERIPPEIVQEVLGYLGKSDIINLMQCNSHLHDRYIGHVYEEILIYAAEGLNRIVWREDRPKAKPDDIFACHSKRGLAFVRHFSVITRGDAARTGYDWARKSEDEFTEKAYGSILVPIAKNGVLARFQWHRAEGKTPSFMPEVLGYMSQSLVSLSMDVDGTSDGCLTAEDFKDIRFSCLKKIRLAIKPSERNVKIAYALLTGSPELVDVDLDFMSFQRPLVGSRRYENLSDDEEKNALDLKRDPDDYFLQCSALGRLSKLERLGISYADCKDIVSSVRLENLKEISFRYCRNWEVIADYTKTHRLRLKHVHISAEAAEAPAIKSFLESGIEPGLNTLSITIHPMPEEENIFTLIRLDEKREQSIYFLTKDSVMKHAATLQNVAFYVALDHDDGYWPRDCLTRYVSVLPYLSNIRQMLETSPNLRELSLVVPLWYGRDTWYEVEVDSFRNMRLENIEVLYLCPNTWPHFVYYDGSDGSCPEYGIQWMIIDFLEAAFQHFTGDHPKLRYVIFGLQNHAMPPLEYEVKWLEGITQQDEDEGEYGDRDKYVKPETSAGEWTKNDFNYEKYKEETDAEAFGRDFMAETQKNRLRRKRDGLFPVKWNPHLKRVDISRMVTHRGPNMLPFRLYSSRFQENEEGIPSQSDWSLIGNGLSMY
ncbi:hypothetical protein TWF481_010924 [Arthrobotrys musiformis]|uniref:F-box domain-containing protein n=1 Tax=Arthrobotrys musiformis TaxID=47236 RepID=A0AAV9VYX5_9PEZI